MRLGIHPILKREAGGIYQYGITMLESLDALARRHGGDEWVVLAHDVHDPALARFKRPTWVTKPFRPQGRRAESGSDGSVSIDTPHHQADMQAWLTECGIELMLYPAPHRLSFETDIPFVMAIHDLQHRLQPEFPEVSTNGEWERREYLFRNAARRATMLIAESPVGREDILRFYGEYGVSPDMVKVLPYLPAHIDNTVASPEAVCEQRAIPRQFLFYPAQFWPHKNHLRIVQALGLIKKRNDINIPIVFTGSARGELREAAHAEILREAEQLGVRDQVLDLGYVTDHELSALYRAAAALIMPTFFGPTNIPILEAWSHGCPVLTSDIRGVRDQAGDAAMLVDPRNVEAIAEGMRSLWTDENLRGDLVARGTRRIALYTADDYRARLYEILNEAKDRVRRQHSVTLGA